MTPFLSPSIIVAGEEVRILAGDDHFSVACSSSGCRDNCCTKSAPVVLNPYEIARICSASGLSYEDLLDVLDTGRDRGFPIVMLPRDPACLFWSDDGCRIYDARPLACRLFPLGRVFHQGRSYIVLPPRNLCSAVMSNPRKTVADYIMEQGAEPFIAMADRWIEFVLRMEGLSLPDRPITSVAFHLLVYSPDAVAASLIPGRGLETVDGFSQRLSNAEMEIRRFIGPAS